MLCQLILIIKNPKTSTFIVFLFLTSKSLNQKNQKFLIVFYSFQKKCLQKPYSKGMRCLAEENVCLDVDNIFVIIFLFILFLRIMTTPPSHGRNGSLQNGVGPTNYHPYRPSPPQFSQVPNNPSYAGRSKVNSTHSHSTPWIHSRMRVEEKTSKIVPMFEKETRIRLLQNKEKPKREPRITEPGDIVMRLNQISQLKIDEALYVVNSLLDGFFQMFSETGRVTIRLQACGVDHQGKIKVRIPSRFSTSTPKMQVLTNQVQCVSEIIKAVKDISDFQYNDFYSYYLMSAGRTKCGFKYTKNLIKSYMSCMKQKISSSLNICKVLRISRSLKKSKVRTQPNQILSKQEIGKKTPRFFPKAISSKNTSTEKISLYHKLSKNRKQVKKSIKSGSVQSKGTPPFLSKEKSNKSPARMIPSKSSTNLTPASSKSISNQFSMTFNPRQTIGDWQNRIKESEISTTQKTSSNKDSVKLKDSTDWIFGCANNVGSRELKKFSTHLSHNQLGGDFGKGSDSIKVFQILSLLPEKLDEVESFGESSSSREQIKKEKKEYSQKESEKDRNEKRNEILLKNCWSNKIDDLFSNATPVLNSSRVEGKEPENVLYESVTQKLDKWVRVLGDSFIPNH